MTDAREDRELTHERLLIGIAREARFGRGPVEVVAVQDGIRECVERDRLIVKRRRRWRRLRLRPRGRRRRRWR